MKGDAGSTRGQRQEGTTFRTAEQGRNRWRGDGEPIGYADVDGMEEVEAWECADGCPVAELDRQAPAAGGGGFPGDKGGIGQGAVYGAPGSGVGLRDTGRVDPDGGASRFYYTAKSSSAERNAGLDGFEERDRYKPGGVGGTGGKRSVDAAVNAPPQRNPHPTVKPVAMMRWLVRLVTPPPRTCEGCGGSGRGTQDAGVDEAAWSEGSLDEVAWTDDGDGDTCPICGGSGQIGGLVLDPFTGSGSTGIACVLEGLRFVGVEQQGPRYVAEHPGEPDYVAIAVARIGWWAEHGEDGLRILREREQREERAATVRQARADGGQLDMFGGGS